MTNKYDEDKKKISDAFKKFDEIGLEAFLEIGNFMLPKEYWVHSEEGNLYPSKAIYGYVNKKSSSQCNGTEAREWLARRGYKIISLQNSIEPDFSIEINKLATRYTLGELKTKAKASEAKTTKLSVQSTIRYDRDKFVAAYTLKRANGKCEQCENKAPFNRKSDSSPYLEVHHKIQLANGGPDIIENTIALCPNCHREKHFG